MDGYDAYYYCHNIFLSFTVGFYNYLSRIFVFKTIFIFVWFLKLFTIVCSKQVVSRTLINFMYVNLIIYYFSTLNTSKCSSSWYATRTIYLSILFIFYFVHILKKNEYIIQSTCLPYAEVKLKRFLHLLLHCPKSSITNSWTRHL